MYRRYCKEDIDVGIEANTKWRRLRRRRDMEERIRVYRRYWIEDMEDIETNTKWRRLKERGEGDGAERSDIGDKNCTTEERADCEIDE